MKKNSRIWILIVSIVLIVLAFVLVGCSVRASYQTITYDYGFGYYRSTVVRDTYQSHLLRSFGNMAFVLGIAGVFIYVILAVTAPKAKKGEKLNRDDPKVSHTERVKDTEDVESETIGEEMRED